MFKSKIVPIGAVKAGPADGLAEGEFIVYPSTFIRRPDIVGDVIAKGAFDDTIAKWKASGQTLPGQFGHRFDDPEYYVAAGTDQGVDDRGWWVQGMFDPEPKAQKVYRLVKGRRLGKLSFAYDVLAEGLITLSRDKGDLVDGPANELQKLDVHEFSFVPFAANDDTFVAGIKQDQAAAVLQNIAAELKAGRVLSSKNETLLRAAYESIGNVLDGLEKVPDDGKAKADEPQHDPAAMRQALVKMSLEQIELAAELIACEQQDNTDNEGIQS